MIASGAGGFAAMDATLQRLAMRLAIRLMRAGNRILEII
jgi:hypothetical protein